MRGYLLAGLLAGALAGCWRSNETPTSTPAEPPPPSAPVAPCSTLGERWLALRFSDTYPHADPAMQQAFLVARADFGEQCSRRRWTSEMRRCIVFAVKKWELDACLSRLPHVDRRVISRREIDLLTQLRDVLER